MVNSEELAVELATSITTLSSSLSYATTSINSSASAFTSIVQKIELRFQELKTRENKLNQRKKQLDEFEIKLQQWEERLKREDEERTTKIEELKEKQEAWDITESRMKANFNLVAEVVTLNVGGQKFSTTKQALTRYQGSYFATLFHIDHTNNSEKFFIDRDPKYFAIILNFLREGKISAEIKLKDIPFLREEFAFYKIPLPLEFNSLKDRTRERELLGSDNNSTRSEHRELRDSRSESSRNDMEIVIRESAAFNAFNSTGDLLTNDLKKVVFSWLPNTYFHLLYKATLDGFSADRFHQKCDSHSPTFTLIKSTEGYLFGGYTHTKNKQIEAFKFTRVHHKSFLFTLTNPHSLPPRIFPLLPGNYKTTDPLNEHLNLGGDFSSWWGKWRYDVGLSLSANVDNKSYVGFPLAFKDTSGHGNKTFTGNENFTVRDIEVFSVVPDFSTNINDSTTRMY